MEFYTAFSDPIIDNKHHNYFSHQYLYFLQNSFFLVDEISVFLYEPAIFYGVNKIDRKINLETTLR